MAQIKAIQTRYKGYHFRSRLEARWAVFFDALGLQWEYEPEGFELPDGTWYLPDFRVTNPNSAVSWYEVKPKNAPEDEKFLAFRKAMCRHKVVEELCLTGFQQLSGDPLDFLDFGEDNPSGFRICPNCGEIDEPMWVVSGGNNFSTVFACAGCCVKAHYLGVEVATASAIVPCTINVDAVEIASKSWKVYTRKITAAAHAARSARFEHGQSGAS